MTDPEADPETAPGAGAQEFELRAFPPVRALAIAAGAALVAIVMLAFTPAGRGSTGFTVAAVVLLAAGVALALGAVFLSRALRASVRVDDRALTVRRGRRTESLAWPDTSEVRLQGVRLTAVAKQGAVVTLISPRGPEDPTFVAMLLAIRKRLDADRGYGGRPF